MYNLFLMAPWIIYALLSALFAALTAIFAKVGLTNVNSDVATAIRTGIILLITWGIVFFRGKINDISVLSKTNWIFLSLSAVATGLSWLFYYRALQLGEVSQVSAIDKGSIVFTIVLSFIFLREPVTSKILIGGALIFIGMMVIIWK
jgi:bacterial/archaeal transporter family protein